MITLRYYQNDCIRHTFNYINKGGRAGLAVLPTGSGKSIILAEIVKTIMKKRPYFRAMMLTHVKELIEQNYDKLRTVFPTVPAGIYSAGIGKKQYTHPIIYGGIQSCYRRAEIFGHIDLLLIDEAHLISDKSESMYGKMIAVLKSINPDLVIIGVTATPYRLGMGYLTEGPIFNDIFYDISTMDDFVRLIDEGYLCDLVPVDTDVKYDLSEVKKSGGEFQEKSLDDNVNRDEVTREVVLETIRRTQDRNKGLAFCVSKSHAENMALRFTEAGYPSTFIHSGLNKTERETILDEYKQGKYKVLCNVGVLTTGFDAPDIDFIVLSRPTESTGLHVQMLGRGMRPHPSKPNTLVLDFAGNTLRLGPINDPVVPLPAGQKGGEAPIRICDECNTINHAAVRFCKECGFEFPPPKVKFTANASMVDIIKRKDIPKIEDREVQNYAVETFTSRRGNKTVKLNMYSGETEYSMFMTVDPKMNKGFTTTRQFLSKMNFSEKIPKFKDNEHLAEFIREKFIPPERIKVWLNKPDPNTKSVKRKAILDFLY